MRKPIACSMLLAAAFALAACRQGPDEAPLVVVIGSGPAALGLAEDAPGDAASAVLRGATAQGLVRLDAAAQVEGGLAERWNVSDDGLSYIFRLQQAEWPDGQPIRARDIARQMTRQLKGAATMPVRDAAGAIDEVVAMTDRVIEIRLKAPRPNLLTLLAQPEFALIRDGVGSGPFTPGKAADDTLLLTHRAPGFDGEAAKEQQVRLRALEAPKAVAAFVSGSASLVLGGTVADLPLARNATPPRGALQFDPVAGLFGLLPGRKSGLAGDKAARLLLSQAIDRQALLAALAVPGLEPRATLLQGGLNGMPAPVQPAWLSVPLDGRRGALRERLAPSLPQTRDGSMPKVMVWAPAGPGGDMIVARLAIDWGALGVRVERAKTEAQSDFRFIDEVAPSDSPAWFARRLRCDFVTVCDEDVDRLTEDARLTLLPQARAGLISLAAQKVDDEALFIAIAAPIRWSLVSKAVPGFTPNRYARHSLLGLTAPQSIAQ